jgi:hypothetical protein
MGLEAAGKGPPGCIALETGSPPMEGPAPFVAVGAALGLVEVGYAGYDGYVG